MALSAPLPALAEGGAPPPLTFDVIRKGDTIGSHRLNFSRDGGELRVEVVSEIAVRMFGLTVFRYAHRNKEVWRDGELAAIDSQTNNDGDAEFVRGMVAGRAFAVEATSGPAQLERPVVPTSYWNKAILGRPAWLDTQNGRLARVDVSPVQGETLTVAGRKVPTTRYRVTGDVRADLWYDRDGKWVQAHFTAPDGSIVEYRLR